ncbi:unnamed protein product [Malus baccata var. baccata]
MYVTSQPGPPPHPGLDSIAARYYPFWASTTPSGFCFWELTRELPSRNSHENFPVGHPSWDCSCANSFNFEIPMEPEASELPKGLALGRDENIHIRLKGFIPLGDMGCSIKFSY